MRRTPSEFALGEGRYFEPKNTGRQAARPHCVKKAGGKMGGKSGRKTDGGGEQEEPAQKKKPDRQV